MIRLPPDDASNRTLIENVHPSDWQNPQPAGRYNLVVIGAGAAGLVTAAGAAGVGAKVALIERHLMGGDCLNVGCVPSKSLLRTAHTFAALGELRPLGISGAEGAAVDFKAVMARMREVRARISPIDSARRFRDELGVDVFLGDARFTDSEHVSVGDQQLSFARAVVATGASAFIPPIPGLAECGYLTNDTVFELTELPRRLLVIGGGPIGCELAQAFQRFGSAVTLVELEDRFLAREDPEAAALLHATLEQDGVDIRLGTRLTSVARGDDAKHATLEGPEGPVDVEYDALLLAVGRTPNIDGLGLDAAGIEATGRGVVTDDRLRTTNSRVYACGDVCLPAQFTHAADFAARLVVQNALFFGRGRYSALTIPRCTYTAPEIAGVGLSEQDAAAQGVAIDTWKQPFADIDRAITDGDETGFVKIFTEKGRDRIVGATIVGSHAGEAISEVSVAMASGLKLGQLARVIHPYPTRSEAIRKIGDAFNRTRLTPTVSRLFNRFLSWRR
jgi:pyruvate/2-oxoglutarate dehydrogenase complex dihydrolipoamide dehydrogenase (E3) component